MVFVHMCILCSLNSRQFCIFLYIFYIIFFSKIFTQNTYNAKKKKKFFPVIKNMNYEVNLGRSHYWVILPTRPCKSKSVYTDVTLLGDIEMTF